MSLPQNDGPLATRPQNFLDSDFSSLRRSQLFCPLLTSARTCAGTDAVKFGITRGTVGFGLFPVVPALRPDDTGHSAIQPDDAGINSPGPAEISFDAVLAVNVAMGKDEAKGLVLGCGGGGDITVAQTMNMAVFKPGGGRAKNEIHMAFNIAIVEELASAIEEDRILPAEKTAMPERVMVAIHPNGQGLSDGTGGVLEGDVFRGKMVGVNSGGGGFKGAEGFAIHVGHAGIQIEGDNGFDRIITDEMEEGLLTLHIEQLAIDAGFDVNDDRVGSGAGGHGHDGILYACELAGAIGGDEDVRLRIRRNGSQERRSEEGDSQDDVVFHGWP